MSSSSIYPPHPAFPLGNHKFHLFIPVTLRKEKFIAMVLKEKEGNKYNTKYFIVRRKL